MRDRVDAIVTRMPEADRLAEPPRPAREVAGHARAARAGQAATLAGELHPFNNLTGAQQHAVATRLGAGGHVDTRMNAVTELDVKGLIAIQGVGGV